MLWCFHLRIFYFWNILAEACNVQSFFPEVLIIKNYFSQKRRSLCYVYHVRKPYRMSWEEKLAFLQSCQKHMLSYIVALFLRFLAYQEKPRFFWHEKKRSWNVCSYYSSACEYNAVEVVLTYWLFYLHAGEAPRQNFPFLVKNCVEWVAKMFILEIVFDFSSIAIYDGQIWMRCPVKEFTTLHLSLTSMPSTAKDVIALDGKCSPVTSYCSWITNPKSPQQKRQTCFESFWGFERTERSEGSDEVAYCSDIDGFAFFCFFFNFLRTISWHLQKILSLNAFISETRRGIGSIFS